jgi:ATP-dependent DNA ligase
MRDYDRPGPSSEAFADRYSDRGTGATTVVPSDLSSQQRAPLRPCTYPARPLNGGPLDRALPKSGQWHYEPKYNGWRALVHAPTGTLFNRHGQRLSIEKEFGSALALLRGLHLNNGAVVEWFDCEALERRHAIGQATLLVFDYISPAGEAYQRRKQRLAHALAVHDCRVQPHSDAAYSVGAFGSEELDALELYQRLKQLNVQWHCPFYEGVVAKRTDSIYPIQLRSAALEFAGWMKHRWL